MKKFVLLYLDRTRFWVYGLKKNAKMQKVEHEKTIFF